MSRESPAARGTARTPRSGHLVGPDIGDRTDVNTPTPDDAMNERPESDVGLGCAHYESALARGDDYSPIDGMTRLGAGGHEPPHDADPDCFLFQCPKCAIFWRYMFRVDCADLPPNNSDGPIWREHYWCNKLTPAKFKELQALRRA